MLSTKSCWCIHIPNLTSSLQAYQVGGKILLVFQAIQLPPQLRLEELIDGVGFKGCEKPIYSIRLI
ncbi:ATV_HP_G0139030.mRNA.1.CDS.1 [Saccharomyces cerevisiae]|nr:ATV_HP_G0139030.mRNA.1.CDS.1 [Saccharomyces cerevisiae]CAI6896743.1 ATV_HP_G0139030.mRNA.1.CDS.1 [Saccharomyces cerevisiae]